MLHKDVLLGLGAAGAALAIIPQLFTCYSPLIDLHGPYVEAHDGSGPLYRGQLMTGFVANYTVTKFIIIIPLSTAYDPKSQSYGIHCYSSSKIKNNEFIIKKKWIGLFLKFICSGL